MGDAGSDSFVCLKCGAWWGSRGTGKCANCGGMLKADRLITEDEWDHLFELGRQAEAQ